MNAQQRRLGILLFVGVIGCSSGGGTGGGFGEDAGTSGGCSGDSDCKGSRICKSGVCVDAQADTGSPSHDTGTPTLDTGVCGAEPGDGCSATKDCCQSSARAPKGQICLSDDSSCHAKCTNDYECTSGCCAALKGESYGACAATSFCPAGGIGDACATSSSCSVGSCAGTTRGWCSRGCSYSSDCNGSYSGGVNKYGGYNFCIAASSGSNFCFPACASDADCTWYPGTVCRDTSTTTGTTVRVCGK